MHYEDIIPNKYPTNLLPDKDWSKRKCYHYWHKPLASFQEMVHQMEVKDDDVWIVTLPKCGTTWMQELVWLVLHDFDFETAKKEHLELRSPFLEFDYRMNNDINTAFESIENLKPPRLIKTHFPLPLLPAKLWEKTSKVIYVYRTPTDALISMFYHGRNLGHNLDMNLESYLREYVKTRSQFDRPFDHVIEFYTLRNEPWLYYTSFERMKLNLQGVITDICKFLNKPINDVQMQQMLKHLSFDEMKNNPTTNHLWDFDQVREKFNITVYESHNFVRKGKMNGYKEELTPEFVATMDKWIKDNLSKHNLTLNELLLLGNK